MKKLTASFILLLTFSAVACSSAEDPTSSLIGTWQAETSGELLTLSTNNAFHRVSETYPSGVDGSWVVDADNNLLTWLPGMNECRGPCTGVTEQKIVNQDAARLALSPGGIYDRLLQ